MLDPNITRHVEEALRLKAVEFDRSLQRALADPSSTTSSSDINSAHVLSMRVGAIHRRVFTRSVQTSAARLPMSKSGCGIS